MSQGVATSIWPHASKVDFLSHGLEEVRLEAALDCSICREPLATTTAISAASYLPRIDTTTLPRVTACPGVEAGSAYGANEAPINTKFPQARQAFDPEVHDIVPEPAVRIEHCAHIFGSTCLSTWFSANTSNRCPECNQALFPKRHFHLVLSEPSREARLEFVHIVEHVLEDLETANQIRLQLMSEWTKTLMRSLAVEIHHSLGYENVTWEYRDEATQRDDEEEEEEEDYNDEEVTGNKYEEEVFEDQGEDKMDDDVESDI